MSISQEAFEKFKVWGWCISRVAQPMLTGMRKAEKAAKEVQKEVQKEDTVSCSPRSTSSPGPDDHLRSSKLWYDWHKL